MNDILIISTPNDTPLIRELLQDGSQWGIKLSYAIQDSPEGIGQAFTIAHDFIDNDQVVLILGDNLFYGYYDFLREALENNSGCTAFGYHVKSPHRYGVVEFDKYMNIRSLQEKPENPRSNYAIPGLYIFSPDVKDFAVNIKPSARGEFEITDILQLYLDQNRLSVELIGRGFAWFDCGTPNSLQEASSFISSLEKRQGLKFGCPEEIAVRMGYLSSSELKKLISTFPTCTYHAYLKQFVDTMWNRYEE